MDRRTLTKLILVTGLVLGYIVIAAFGFHQEIIAPIIVVGIVAVLFVPFGSGKATGSQEKKAPASSGAADR